MTLSSSNCNQCILCNTTANYVLCAATNQCYLPGLEVKFGSRLLWSCYHPKVKWRLKVSRELILVSIPLFIGILDRFELSKLQRHHLRLHSV